MGVLRCGSSCFLRGNLQGECEAKKSCACMCEQFKAQNMNLFDACVGLCNSNDPAKRPKSKDAFLKTFDAADLYNRYKIILPGFDPTLTTEYKLQEDKQKRNTDQEGFLQKIVLFSLVVLACIGAFVAFKK